MAKTPCAKCGSCTTVCPVYQITGRESLTARGRHHLIEKLADSAPSREYIDIFSCCLLCKACTFNCPRGINLPAMVIEARQDFQPLFGSGSFKKHLADKCLSSDRMLKGLAAVLKLSKPLLEQIPPGSGLRMKLGIMAQGANAAPPEPETIDSAKEGCERIMIFKGCLATHLYPEITTAAGETLARQHDLQITTPNQHCCGLASFSSGNLEAAKDLARQNIAAFTDNSARIITTCASCFSHLTTYPNLLADDHEWAERAKSFAGRLAEFSSFLSAKPMKNAEKMKDPGGKLRVLYHDPCHLRFRDGDFQTPPRKLLASLPDIELVELPRGPRCCGLGGLFNLAHPDLSEKIGARLVSELKEVQPDIIVSTCSGCLLQLKFLAASEKDLHAEICHLAELVNR